MIQLATSYLTLTDAVSSFSFLKQPCQKTHPVVMEKMSISFRRVKLLAFIGVKKILNDHDRWSLKRLVKSNRKKTTVELMDMFNRESKSISTRTMRRELKGLGLNSCIALRKPLIGEANRWKKGFNLLGSIKIGLWSNGRRSCGLMSPDLPCFRVMGTSG